MTAIDTNNSTWVSDARVLSVGSSEMAVTRVPPGTATACTRYCRARDADGGHVDRGALGRVRAVVGAEDVRGGHVLDGQAPAAAPGRGRASRPGPRAPGATTGPRRRQDLDVGIGAEPGGQDGRR